jgi:branched-chain amino acid transport system substrate-binding protein
MATVVGCFAVLFLYWAAVGNVSKRRALARSHRAQQAKSPAEIQIAVVWTDLDPGESFIRGVNLACDEINERGGVLGRHVKLVFYREGVGVAARLARDVNTVAVVGYEYSSAALRDSVTLNNEGIIFMIPVAGDWALTLKDFDYSFRIVPNSLRVADWLTRHALIQAARARTITNGELAVAILSPRDGFGYELERHFRKDAADWRLLQITNGVTNSMTMRVAASKSYETATTDFLPFVDSLMDSQFDAVMVTGDLPCAGLLIRQMRNMGINKPVFGGRGLDSEELLSVASNRAFRVYFPSKFTVPDAAAFASMPTNLLIHAFVRRFIDRHKVRPDFPAAQGYEAIELLAEAFQRAGTTDPVAVSSVFEHTGDWVGLLETYPKFLNHELVVSNIFIKYVAPAGGASNDLRSNQDYALKHMNEDPYTNELILVGRLAPPITNRVVNVDHVMHVPPHYPTGVY